MSKSHAYLYLLVQCKPRLRGLGGPPAHAGACTQMRCGGVNAPGRLRGTVPRWLTRWPLTLQHQPHSRWRSRRRQRGLRSRSGAKKTKTPRRKRKPHLAPHPPLVACSAPPLPLQLPPRQTTLCLQKPRQPSLQKPRQPSLQKTEATEPPKTEATEAGAKTRRRRWQVTCPP